MFARFDENPAMTLQVIKETKRYGRTDARTDNVKTVYPPSNKVCGGYNENSIPILKQSLRGYNYVLKSLTSKDRVKGINCLTSENEAILVSDKRSVETPWTYLV